MAGYEFQSGLYRSQREMLDAVARAWLSPDGDEDARDTLVQIPHNDVLADECICAWSLADGNYDGWDDGRPSHMEKHGYERADLIAAFARERKRLMATDPLRGWREIEAAPDA